MLARLLLLFIGIPVLELFLFLLIGSKIGITATLAIIIVTGFLGAYLTKSQGLKALKNYQDSLAAGKLPHEAVLDGLMILIAGAVLLTPGFLTDAIGFSLLVPAVRKNVRAILSAYLKGKIHIVGQDMGAASTGTPGKKRSSQDVITVEAEVVEDSAGPSRTSTQTP